MQLIFIVSYRLYFFAQIVKDMKMNKLLLTVAIIIALSISPFTYASEICQPPPPDRYVKDSYVVDFIANPASPVIWPAKRDPNSLNPVPFGENSSGQSKEELAKTLGINGQVIYIFDAINAAEIHMDAEEAYKLSLDPRVVRVTQEQIMEMPEMAFKAKAPTCHPVYDEGLLTVPSIDTAEQLGKFQDVVLKPTTEGTWQLLKGNASGNDPTYAPITEVKVITTRSFPAQVFYESIW
jgi:hypothetical protein